MKDWPGAAVALALPVLRVFEGSATKGEQWRAVCK
jgi:hypothetical protein